MAARYEAHHPEHYPIAWLSAARLAIERRNEENPWVSVDWSRGESGAINRMKRLRAFRDGAETHKRNYPDFSTVLLEGRVLAFRKLFIHGVWDIQLAWKIDSRAELLAIARTVGGEDMPEKY